MQKPVGQVVDAQGCEIDVWLTENGSHVVLYDHDAQIGDFPLGQPCKADPLQVAAQRVASGEAKRLCVIFDEDDDPVLIEDFPSGHDSRTLRRWPGDGKVH